MASVQLVTYYRDDGTPWRDTLHYSSQVHQVTTPFIAARGAVYGAGLCVH